MSRKILVLTFLTGLLLAPLSHATLMTYSYVGPDFNDPSPLPSPYQAGDHIEGFFTIDDSFLDPTGRDNLSTFCPPWAQCEDFFPPDEAWLIDWMFTDGVNTYSPDGPALVEWDFRLGFDSLEMVSWNVTFVDVFDAGLFTACGSVFVNEDCAGSPSGGADGGAFPGNAGEFISASVRYQGADASTWDRSPAAVPEPTTLALLSLGLTGLGITRRRMKA